MTPYEIRTLFHIHHIVAPLQECRILSETLDWMSRTGLIEKSDEKFFDLVSGEWCDGTGWRCTEAGKDLVKRICEVKP